MERYKVIEGSQSCHCCFEWTVVDTSRSMEYTESGYPAVCECFDRADAEEICIALNAFSGPPQPSTTTSQ